MSMYTVIGPDGKERGPIAAGQIKDWIAHEGFSSDSMIKSNETGEWKRVREIPELCVGSKPPSATSDLATGSQSNGIIKYMLKGVDGKEYGPMTGEEIKDSLDRKRLLPTTLARQVGETGLWQYLFEHPEIYDSSLQPHRPNQGIPTPPDWAPLQERIGAHLKFLPEELRKSGVVIFGGGFLCLVFLLVVWALIFVPPNKQQDNPSSNSVAAVTPAAVTNGVPTEYEMSDDEQVLRDWDACKSFQVELGEAIHEVIQKSHALPSSAEMVVLNGLMDLEEKAKQRGDFVAAQTYERTVDGERKRFQNPDANLVASIQSASLSASRTIFQRYKEEGKTLSWSKGAKAKILAILDESGTEIVPILKDGTDGQWYVLPDGGSLFLKLENLGTVGYMAVGGGLKAGLVAEQAAPSQAQQVAPSSRGAARDAEQEAKQARLAAEQAAKQALKDLFSALGVASLFYQEDDIVFLKWDDCESYLNEIHGLEDKRARVGGFTVESFAAAINSVTQRYRLEGKATQWPSGAEITTLAFLTGSGMNIEIEGGRFSRGLAFYAIPDSKHLLIARVQYSGTEGYLVRPLNAFPGMRPKN